MDVLKFIDLQILSSLSLSLSLPLSLFYSLSLFSTLSLSLSLSLCVSLFVCLSLPVSLPPSLYLVGPYLWTVLLTCTKPECIFCWISFGIGSVWILI